MDKLETSSTKNIYQDRQFIMIGVVIVTFCLTFIGTDHSFNEILNDHIIFEKLILNGLTVIVAWLGIRRIIIFFDHKMPWQIKISKRRWLIQLPLSLVFIFSIFLFQLYNRTFFIPEWKLFPKTVWSVDLPLTLLFGLSFNFLYYHWWMQNQRQMAEEHTRKKHNTQSISASSSNISVKKGRKTILIPPHEIAYAFRIEEFNYLVTQNGEKYLLDVSLNALEKELSTVDFFRLNRQLLAHRNAIQTFQTLPNRHLQVTLQPALEGNLSVNKNKAASFKKWVSAYRLDG